MLVMCHNTKFDVPDQLIDQFVKDFNSAPGGKYRENVLRIRCAIEEILGIVAKYPDLLFEKDKHTYFLRTLAMKQALEKLGILYDS